MSIARTQAMITKHTERLCKAFIIGYTDTCFAISSQVFTVVEAKTADIPKTPNPLSLIGCTMCLRRIFDNMKTMRTCKIQYVSHFRWMTIQMYREQSTSTGSKCPLKLSPIHGIGAWIDINKDFFFHDTDTTHIYTLSPTT